MFFLPVLNNHLFVFICLLSSFLHIQSGKILPYKLYELRRFMCQIPKILQTISLCSLPCRICSTGCVQLGKPFQSGPAKSASINNHVAKEHVEEEVFLILLTDDNREDAKTRFIIQSQSFSVKVTEKASHYHMLD